MSPFRITNVITIPAVAIKFRIVLIANGCNFVFSSKNIASIQNRKAGIEYNIPKTIKKNSACIYAALSKPWLTSSYKLKKIGPTPKTVNQCIKGL